jgi:tRNA(Ile)-lysidine synthase
LRDWLRAQDIPWVDDPSNDDQRFDRVRARNALAELDRFGVSAEALSRIAGHMRDARDALDYAAEELAEKAAQWGNCGELRIALAPLRAAPPELVRRLMRAALTRVSGAAYGPRAEAEASLISNIMGLKLGGGRSLHGCLIRPEGPAGIMLTREFVAVSLSRVELDCASCLWDGRFRLQVRAKPSDAHLAPVGEAGIAHLAKLDRMGVWQAPADWIKAPVSARLSTPALWQGQTLCAAPLAGFGDSLTAEFAFLEKNWVYPPQESA